MRRRLFISFLALAFTTLFALITSNTASAQATCTYYTVDVDPALAACLRIRVTTYWTNPLVHDAIISATGQTIVPAPVPPGFFFPTLNRVDINGIQIFPSVAPLVIRLLPCGLCAQIFVSKDINGCIYIRIVAHPGPC
jgi:hypothetical protein